MSKIKVSNLGNNWI